MVDERRVRYLVDQKYSSGPVLYWMQRDQRVQDNWALLFAQQKALEYKVPLVVCFTLDQLLQRKNPRQYMFQLEGLALLQGELEKMNINFLVLEEEYSKSIVQIISDFGIGFLVKDFSPLKDFQKQNKWIMSMVSIPSVEVDAHNCVPVWEVSDKQEFAAYTIRPKIHKKIDSFLVDFPLIKKHPFSLKKISGFRLSKRVAKMSLDFTPGEKAARAQLLKFMSNSLPIYAEKRNDPNAEVQSNLSPYLHFGHISAARVALEIQKNTIDDENQEVFLEELIVRKELSDNFCFYNPQYDSFDGFPSWAQKTLNEHRLDARKYIYSKKDFTDANTHEPLWNAAQTQLVVHGKMHGYLRMYWAKKILEWSRSPEEALSIAIELNDGYSLDGNDPNGFVGVAWSIGGVHDRAWFERDIYGKVRYMNANGAKRKFDTDAYIAMWNEK